MPDDFDGFCNAWISVFNRHPPKILRSWDVDCDWRGALKFISDKEKKCQIYHTLHTLLVKITTTLNYFSMSLRDVPTISTQCFAK